jgi:hypothetical protein
MFVPFLVPLVPLAIALLAFKGLKLFTLGLVALAVWLAWRMSWRFARRARWERGDAYFGPRPDGTAVPPSADPGPPASPVPPASAPPSKDELSAVLARAALRRGGALTVSEGVADTGAPFLDVSEVLDRLDRDGYVTVVHRPGSDEAVYRFQEIAPASPPATPTPPPTATPTPDPSPSAS